MDMSLSDQILVDCSKIKRLIINY